MNWSYIEKNYLNALRKYYEWSLGEDVDWGHKRHLYDYFDKQGIRCFVYYNEMNGKYKPEIRHKKTKEESKGDSDWKMIRIGFVNCYNTRQEAEEIVFYKAFEILEEILTK